MMSMYFTTASFRSCPPLGQALGDQYGAIRQASTPPAKNSSAKRTVPPPAPPASTRGPARGPWLGGELVRVVEGRLDDLLQWPGGAVAPQLVVARVADRGVRVLLDA